MIFEIQQTEVFTAWITNRRDERAKAKILRRIDRMRRGNFGDHKGVGGGVSKMRVGEGPGYRVYYTERGKVRVLLLCGGDKGSQDRDIERAKAMAEEIK